MKFSGQQTPDNKHREYLSIYLYNIFDTLTVADPISKKWSPWEVQLSIGCVYGLPFLKLDGRQGAKQLFGKNAVFERNRQTKNKLFDSKWMYKLVFEYSHYF